MKRTVILALLGLAMAMPSFGQYSRYGNRTPQRRYNNAYTSRWRNYDRETYFGLRLGVAVSTINSDGNLYDGGDAKSGINLGVVAGTQLASNTPFFLEGGLYYTEKGGKGYNVFNGAKQNSTARLSYLEVPIVVKYKYFIDNDFALQPYFGGYMSCGVGGKIKYYGSRQAEDSFDDSYFQRFDGGLRLGCGLSFQNLYIDMAYDFGLANIGQDDFDTSHTGCFFANIGVDF
jgi:hypothetical protein